MNKYLLNGLSFRREDWKLSDDERIRRVHDVHQIRYLMSRHFYYETYNQDERDLQENWVRGEELAKTASYGVNDGYMVGLDCIRENMVERKRLWLRKSLSHLAEQKPELASEDLVPGTGFLQMHLCSTPVIEVARDGKTARGAFYTHGFVAYPSKDGSFSRWLYTRVGADFYKEDGVWKIWHLFLGTDNTAVPGENFEETVKPYDPVWQFMHDGNPETDVHLNFPMKDAYTFLYGFSDYPPVPEQYETFDPTIGCGPEGNPRYVK